MLPEISSVKSRRQGLGIKQKQLAEMAGVSQSLIAKLENKGIEISYSLAKRIFLALDKAEHTKEKKCSEIMTRKMIIVRKNDRVSRASELMKKNSIDQLPVVENNRVVGSISESLIFNRIMSGSKNKILALQIKEIMTEPFPTVNAEMPISTVLPMLKSADAIIVYQKDKLVGIITKANLI